MASPNGRVANDETSMLLLGVPYEQLFLNMNDMTCRKLSKRLITPYASIAPFIFRLKTM
jgi:hypothetical protein